MNNLVSIIIPVYNVENFLADTLESVINQTYRNIEVICVDDGSKDNSLSVLNFYSAKDSRIKVISQENAGVGAARNNGIRHAAGDYICFLDSDDFMHPQNIELQLHAIVSTSADIVCCCFKNVPENTQLGGFKTHSPMCPVTENQPVAAFIYKRMPIDSSSCNKLYKTSLVAANPFKPGIARGEDEIFVLNLLTKISKIAYDPLNLVFFRNRSGSLTKQCISETYLFDHYQSFVSMNEILRRPEQLCANSLDEKQISAWMAKKIFKRFVTHVLRKNKDKSCRVRLAGVACDYLSQLQSAKIFQPGCLSLSKRICLYFFQKKGYLGIAKTICKF